MQSVNRIFKHILLTCSLIPAVVSAQENAPFTRYGLGDIFPNENIVNRGMGGVASAYIGGGMLNTVNPATYGGISNLTYELGLGIDARSLISQTPADKYRSANFAPTYLQLGLPISRKRQIGLVFGIRPATRINYNVSEKLFQADSLENLYEGDGGLYQVFAGMGKRWKYVSVGVNGGFQWGSKNIGSKKVFTSDSIFYYRSNSIDTTRFWGMFVNPGITATIPIKEVKASKGKEASKTYISIGASATLQQQLNANTTSRIYTYSNGVNGEIIPIDTIKNELNQTGKIEIPMSYRAGFMVEKTISNLYTRWRLGMDYSAAQWSDYRFYDNTDQVNDAWTLRVGGEYTPNLLNSNSGWQRTTYRAGFYTGKDYLNADGNGYNVWAVTAGFGFMFRKYTQQEALRYNLINTSFEFGKRGSKVNNITESFFKLSVGLSLSDTWFRKRKYD